MPPRKARPNRKTAPPRPSSDFEEIRPQVFFIHNPAVRQIIKGEGTIDGTRFELTSWRREGLLGRLESHGFRVLTLETQIELLPEPPHADEVEPPDPAATRGVHSIRRGDRYSFFDAWHYRWAAIAPLPPTADGQTHVHLVPGWVVRRRQGRGNASYYQVGGQPDHITLLPLDATDALLHGYAQAMNLPHRPLSISHIEAGYLLPPLELPTAYTTLLKRIAEPVQAGWLVDEQALPLARQVYACIGVALTITPPHE
ncbi:MAG: hypothetical protein HC876_12625 [Chloroflexaceae bacterium]|nr:hypothetical protein [Chloroflexaceae bacterium]